MADNDPIFIAVLAAILSRQPVGADTKDLVAAALANADTVATALRLAREEK